jgi:hypothetical protein
LVTPSMTDSVLRLFSAFIPFLELGSSVSIKDVYGVPETTFGGFGLDFFSNYWVRFGGTLTTYVTGLFMCGFLLGKVYVLVSSIARKLGVDEKLIPFPFVFLFLLMYDGRIQLFAGLLLISWVLGKRCSIKILRSLIRAVPGVRSRVGGL